MPAQPTIDSLQRDAAMNALEGESFDVAVIGGGITGAGIAREAALQGMRVALLEANDFASGTSSRSSKLIDGGIRYLEQGEIALVRKTSLERKQIRRLAPHLAEPRWMVMPIAKRARLAFYRAGVTTYEKLGKVDGQDLHQKWTRARLEENEPILDPKRWPFALAYREYLTDDARLVLANMRSAVAHGAVVLNHAPVEAITTTEGKADGLVGRDRFSGREFRVRAGAVINAAGPWVEAVQRLEDPDAKPLLHLSKGIHVSVPAERLPIRNLLVIKARDDRRIFAVRRGDSVYIGTTDTTHHGEAAIRPTIEREDVQYLLDPLPDFFKVAPLSVDDVTGAWAGLRPLIADPTQKNPSELSRRDELLTGPAGVLSVAGGKLTGFRGMARRVLETIAGQKGNLLPVLDDEPPVAGGDFDGDAEALAARLEAHSGLPSPVCQRLARLYGSEAAEVIAAGPERVHPDQPVLVGEVEWAVRQEGAATLEDLLYRRLRLPLFNQASSDALVEPLAQALAAVLGWSDERTSSERIAVRAQMQQDLAFASSGGSPAAKPTPVSAAQSR